jgi:hypothetical protein
MGELADEPEETFTVEYVFTRDLMDSMSYIQVLLRERREHRVFLNLLHMAPGLEERLLQGSEEETRMIADLVRPYPGSANVTIIWPPQIQKGASGARSDDTKSLKSAVVDWITPRGRALDPPISRNIKVDRGFHHEHTGALLCPAGLDWSNAESGR